MREYVFDFDRFEEPDLTTGMREAVTRCRDCKHMCELHPLNPVTGVSCGITVYRCSHFQCAEELPEVDPDGFCAWGEERRR